MIGKTTFLLELACLMFFTIRKFTFWGENTISLFSTLCAELRLICSVSLRYWGININNIEFENLKIALKRIANKDGQLKIYG